MSDEPDFILEEPGEERQELFEAAMTSTEFFKSLEACDSKRIPKEDLAAELDESVIYAVNLKGMK